MNLRQLDKRYFGRQGEPEDVIVGNSADSYLTDARGRKYIDFMMGWCVGNLGWGNTEIRAAARKFDGPDYVHPDYLYRPWAQLAEMLARITPGSSQSPTATPAAPNPSKGPCKSPWPTPAAARSSPSKTATTATPSPP